MVTESTPKAFLITSFTEYVPGSKYATDGFCKTEEVPLPRSHFQEVGLPEEESAKRTTKGAQPAFREEEKSGVNCASAIIPLKISRKIKKKNLPALIKVEMKLGFFKDLNFGDEQFNQK